MNKIYHKKLIVRETFLAMFLVLYLAPMLYAAFGEKPVDISGQLKINRWTLFNSTDEQIRIDTAIEMLKSTDAGARQIVLDALAATDNAAAQSSACKAISSFRDSPKLIPNRDDFIGPLMDVLKGPNTEAANLAAQASLIFTYREVKGRLEAIVKDADLSAAAKRNVVYAIQVRPEKEAVLLLIDLLDSNDKIFASASADALARWLPGTDKQRWQKMRRDIERGRIDIVRQRLLTQQDRIRQLNEEILRWQRRYLVSLDSIYQATADDAVRAKFIADNLAFEHSSVRLWAIEKINMWQKSGKPMPTVIFEKPLVSLASDPEPAVRLAAARQLGLLTNINSADALLSQLKAETNDDIKTEIFVSLGHICNFALSPGAELEIDPQVRIETLRLTVEFFKDNNPAVAAEVLRNLLLQNGLEDAQVKPYFEFIAAGYTKTQDTQIKSRLLEEMARLCGNDSFYRAVAGEVYRNVFLSAVDNENGQIASPAVTGLMKIDQAGAFEILKQKGFTSHPNSKVRDELIATAGQIGTQQDLEWLGVLAMNTGSEQERQRAADAMMNIFQYCKMEILLSWAQQFSSQAKSKNDDFLFARTRLLLEAAEKKAEAEQNGDTLISIRRMLAEHYAESSLYGLAAKYYGMLLQTAADPNEKRQLTVRLLDVNLRFGQTESVKQLLANVLLSSDIRPNSVISRVLNDYFTQNPNTQTIKQMFFAIASINLPQDAPRPLWSKQIKDWQKLLQIDSLIPAAPNTPAEPNKVSAP